MQTKPDGVRRIPPLCHPGDCSVNGKRHIHFGEPFWVSHAHCSCTLESIGPFLHTKILIYSTTATIKMQHSRSVGWDSQAASTAIFFLPETALCGTFHPSFAVFTLSSLSSALAFPQILWWGIFSQINRNHTKYKPICAMMCICAHKTTMCVHMLIFTYDSIYTCRGCVELYVHIRTFFGVTCLALVNCVNEKQIFKPINNGF